MAIIKWHKQWELVTYVICLYNPRVKMTLSINYGWEREKGFQRETTKTTPVALTHNVTAIGATTKPFQTIVAE